MAETRQRYEDRLIREDWQYFHRSEHWPPHHTQGVENLRREFRGLSDFPKVWFGNRQELCIPLEDEHGFGSLRTLVTMGRSMRLIDAILSTG